MNSLRLPQRELDPQLTPYPCQQVLHIHPFYRAAEQPCDAAGGFVLLREGLDQIIVAVAVDDLALQQHVVDHSLQIICLYPHLRNGDHAVQQSHGVLTKLLCIQIQMTAISLCTLQRGKYRAADAHG